MPEITVLMLVSNGEEFIKKSVDSILQQSFTDFELIIMDDGSSDKTVDIIELYKDSRIQLEKRTPNLQKNFNEGLTLAKGEYIAFMDVGDIMHNERLRIQLKRMKLNPEITICSTWAKLFMIDGAPLPSFQFGEHFIKQPILQMLKTNFICHSTIMIRKDFIVKNNISYKDYPCIEDYKMHFDLAKCGGVFFVEPQYLLHKQVAIVRRDDLLAQTIFFKKEILKFLLEDTPNNTLLELNSNLEILEKDKLIEFDTIIQLFSKLFDNIYPSK